MGDRLQVLTGAATIEQAIVRAGGLLMSTAVGTALLGAVLKAPVWLLAFLFLGLLMVALGSLLNALSSHSQVPPASLSDELADGVKEGEGLLAEADVGRLTTGALIDDFYERGERWVQRVRAVLYEREEHRLLERWNEPPTLWMLGRPMLGDKPSFEQAVIGPLSQMLTLLREIKREAAGY